MKIHAYRGGTSAARTHKLGKHDSYELISICYKYLNPYAGTNQPEYMFKELRKDHTCPTVDHKPLPKQVL